MKKLLIMRHAKSDWNQPFASDFERPLNGRGEQDAPRMGEWLAERDLFPDLILSSPAVRARSTAELVADAAGFDCDMALDRRIYHADAATLLEVINGLPDWAETVMLFGHNPGFEDLVSALSGSDERMPTAAIACINLAIDAWAEAERGELQWLATPKTLHS